MAKSTKAATSVDQPSNDVGAAMSKVVVQRVKSPTFQISERIRGMIQGGELSPGMKLPPTRTLAAQLSIDPTAVHRSLAQLVKEGLLVRTPRVGTFVAEPPAGLTRMAYYHRPTVAGHFGNFDRAVLVELINLGHKNGFTIDVISDTRPLKISEKEPHEELLRHTRTRWVQAVVSTSVSPAQVKWYGGLTVPNASLVNPGNARVRREMTSMAVRQLAERGCKRIGMLTTLRIWADPNATPYELGMFEGYHEAMTKLGLPTRPEWIVGMGPQRKPIIEPDMAAHGFNAINQIWDDLPKAQRPDGLFIYPDLVSTGALLAIAMHGVRVPQDLKLVLHANAELPLFCPYPVDRLVNRAADGARILLDSIRDQFAHHAVRSSELPAHIVPHD